jgi:broad specificity polyphosphatase/5'/3'-nucleotidase SurE
VDVMGAAMDAALHDIKYYAGMALSDVEETAENDEDYLDMAALKEKYLKKMKKDKGDSDKSMNVAYGARGEDLYQVSEFIRINTSIGVPRKKTQGRIAKEEVEG